MKSKSSIYLDSVQKKIGLLISTVGLIVVVTNIINRTIRVDFLYAVSGASVWSVFLLVIPFILSVFFENKILKILQIAVLIGMGVGNIMDSYQEFYGPGLFLAGWLLMRHYGFHENRKILKNVVFLVFLVGLSQLSAALHAQESVYAGFTTLWYTLFLILMIIILWRDTVRQKEELIRENHSLKTDYNKLSTQLKEIEDQQKPFSLKECKITPAEERVIKILTVYKASNREIAERLDITEATVKLHLYNIYNKIGVDSRFSIIELCKYNFS